MYGISAPLMVQYFNAIMRDHLLYTKQNNNKKTRTIYQNGVYVNGQSKQEANR